MLRDQLIERMKFLKLHGMADSYDEIAAMAQRSRMTGEKLMLTLLESECAEREARSLAYRLKRARFPIVKELDAFDFSASHVKEETIRSLAEGSFLETATNVILVGGSGTGKTHLATAIGLQDSGTRSIWSTGLRAQSSRTSWRGRNVRFLERIA